MCYTSTLPIFLLNLILRLNAISTSDLYITKYVSDHPPEDIFNAIEKINSLLITLGCLVVN